MTVNKANFGKNSGIDFNLFKGGLKRESLKTESDKSIFDAIDTDKNGVIDEHEIQIFKTEIDEDGDNTISKKEANNFLKNKGLNDAVKKEEVSQFLKGYTDNTEDVSEVKVIKTDIHGNKTVQIMYKDGTSEIINPDRTYSISRTDENGDTTTRYYDENKKLIKEKVTKETGETLETEYAEDGEIPVSTVSQNGSSVSTVSYNNGSPSTKQVKTGITTENYSYDDQGMEVLVSKTENEGIDAKEKKTIYTYNEDGSVTEYITEYNKTTERVISKDGTLISETTIKGANSENYDTKNEIIYNEDGGRSEVFSQPSKDYTRTMEYNSEGYKVSETTVVNGETYRADFDGKGYGTLTMKAGETIDSFSQRTGVPVSEIKANNKFPGGVPQAGQSIKVPEQYVNATDYNNYGVSSAAEKAKGDAAETRLNNVVDNLSETYVQKDTKGKYQSYDEYARKLLKNEGIEPITDELVHKTSKKISQMNGDKEISTLDSINCPVSSGYKKKLDAEEQARSARDEQNATISMLGDDLNTAQSAFDNQLNTEDFTQKIADGVSVIWNSDNRACKVREDLETARSNIDELKKAAGQGDAKFKAKFKEIYGVEYNQEAIEAYKANPTDENYQQAFGTTQNNIIKRVEIYNESQQEGGQAVGDGLSITVGTVVTIGTGGNLGAGLAASSLVSGGIEANRQVQKRGGLENLETTDYMDIAKATGEEMVIGAVTSKLPGSKILVKEAYNITAGVVVDTAYDGLVHNNNSLLQNTARVSGMEALGGVEEKGTESGKKIARKVIKKVI